MLDILKPKWSYPLEREFEAWIIAGIEQYARRLGRKAVIWAVSPMLEPTWPADEAVQYDGKLFGLQFKQPKLERGTLGFDRLKWDLRQPIRQLAMVQGRSEIFYCLPTFVNRDYRRNALQHCLFWRPGQALNPNVWYDNPLAQTPYKNARASGKRWGEFVENLEECAIGVSIRESGDLRSYWDELAHTEQWRELIRASTEDVPFDVEAYRLFLVFFPFG
jgi:hypothetical protein